MTQNSVETLTIKKLGRFTTVSSFFIWTVNNVEILTIKELGILTIVAVFFIMTFSNAETDIFGIR